MDKIVIAIMLCCISCQQTKSPKNYGDFISEGYSLIFGSTFRDIEYHLVTDTLKAGYNTIFSNDTILLDIKEKDKIARSFFEEGINEFYGITNIIGKKWILPASNDQIRIYLNDSLVGTITLNRAYERSTLWRNKREYRAIRFRDTVWEILNKKKKYRTLKNSLTVMMKKDTTLLL